MTFLYASILMGVFLHVLLFIHMRKSGRNSTVCVVIITSNKTWIRNEEYPSFMRTIFTFTLNVFNKETYMAWNKYFFSTFYFTNIGCYWFFKSAKFWIFHLAIFSGKYWEDVFFTYVLRQVSSPYIFWWIVAKQMQYTPLKTY